MYGLGCVFTSFPHTGAGRVAPSSRPAAAFLQAPSRASAQLRSAISALHTPRDKLGTTSRSQAIRSLGMLRSLASSIARPRVGASWRNVTRPGPSSKRMLATEGSSQTYKAKREPLITPTMVLIGIMPIFTFALGTWQVQRLKWKVALIDELEEKLEREPMPLPPQIKCVPRLVPGSLRSDFGSLAALPDFSFRKVVLKGRWDNAHAILLGPRVRDGTIGYHLVVPFVRTDGSTVLVDRGFVSKDLAQTAKQNQSTVQGEVEILGMLRTAQPRNSFTPDNLPDEGKWYWADVDAMAAHAGGEASGVQPVFIEEVFGASEIEHSCGHFSCTLEGHAGDASSRISHGYPVGRSPTVDVRNSHVSYIVTW